LFACGSCPQQTVYQQLGLSTFKAVFCHELLRAKGRKFQDQVQSHSIDVLLG
jgi:hypothetical protein